MSQTMQQLKDAGDRALAGENPWDTFSSYGLVLEDAAHWTTNWIRELTQHAHEIGQDPRTADFRLRIALGCLAVGIEHGRTIAREEAAAASSGRLGS